MKRNQSGFSLLLVLVVIVALALIAGTGWYVLKAREDSDSPTQSTIQVASKDETTERITKNNSQGYLELAGWGVEVRNLDKDFSYAKSATADEKLNGVLYQSLDIWSEKYTALLKSTGCGNYTVFTHLMRVPAGTEVSGGVGSGPTTIGGYDYYDEDDDARDCGGISGAEQQRQLKEARLEEFFKGMRDSD